ncbi:hypothetical protein HF086_016758 [Spodoptera exigua]|uniref:Uncharacterized protein n=1 Tax=Spodoptera exigua TaxID=7107 RepID=A0A922SIN7_SPOEX|nr:hypothetical protein HF086_016758 [Spodoptera exigua]
MLGDNIETLSDELLRLENLLAFIRAKSTHFLMFKLDMFNRMIEQLIALYGREQVLDIRFREYFDIIKLGYYYSGQNLILQVDESCHFTTAQLKTEAVEALDDRHYVVSFPTPTKIRLSCSETQYNIVQGSYLITIPKGCVAQTPAFTLANKNDRIKGQVLKIMNIPFQDEAIYNLEARKLTLNSADLRSLHVATQEISMETPLKINQTDIHSVYYTITPLYLVLLGASALGIGYAIRRYLNQRSLKTTTEHQTNEIESGEVYAEINKHTPAPQPRLSALLSNLSNNSR